MVKVVYNVFVPDFVLKGSIEIPLYMSQFGYCVNYKDYRTKKSVGEPIFLLYESFIVGKVVKPKSLALPVDCDIGFI